MEYIDGKGVNVVELPLDSIIPDPNQPRKTFDEGKLQELAESIKQHGLLQPILVCPIGDGKYQIVHGERRWRACRLAGLTSIKAEVRELDDKQKMEIQLIENLQREDLNPLEEAEMFHRLINEFGYTHEELAHRIGKSREYVTNKLRLLKLSKEVKEDLKEGKITEGHARPLLSLGSNEQKEALDKILSEGLSVRQTESFIKGNNVSRETSNSIPEDGLVIGVWVSERVFRCLSRLASSKGKTVEELCSHILEREVMGYEESSNEEVEHEV